jgi:hypothetical protein
MFPPPTIYERTSAIVVGVTPTTIVDKDIVLPVVLGKLLGFSSERAWHRFVTGNLFTTFSIQSPLPSAALCNQMDSS